MAVRKRSGVSDWDDLRFLLALARRGSLSAAARALGVTHATVSRRLGSLERSLGQELVERRADRFELTEAGRRVLDRALAVEAQLAELEGAPAAEGLSGTVRLSATEGVAVQLAVPGLAPLLERHPALALEVVADSQSVSLARREADLALRWARPEEGGLIARRLRRVRFDAYAAPAYLARHQEGAPHRLVGYADGLDRLPEAGWLRRRFPDAGFALRTNGPLALLAAVQAGMGVGALADFMATPGLVRLDPEGAPLERELWLVQPADTRGVPRIRAVRDALAALLGE